MNQHITLKAIEIQTVDGEARTRDESLGVRLGFSQPRDIRKLIARHGGALSELGHLFFREEVVGKGQRATVYYLNRKQAVYIAAKSDTDEATDITIEVVKRFDDYESGTRAAGAHVPSVLPNSREARLQFRLGMTIAKMAGYEGNQLLLSAAKIAKAATGFDYLETIGAAALPAPTDSAMLTPSGLGERLGGMSGKAVNVALSEFGFHEMFRDHAGRPYYEPTEKGRAAGGRMMDTGKRHSNGTPVSQLKWPSSVADDLAALLKVEA